MKSYTYYFSQNMHIDCFGDGLAYLIVHHNTGQTAYLQGDDAIQFEKEIELTNEEWTVEDVCKEYL